MDMEQVLKWELAGENLPQYHYIHRKSHTAGHGTESGLLRWEAGDLTAQLTELWQI
jgi:hypothetical protein